MARLAGIVHGFRSSATISLMFFLTALVYGQFGPVPVGQTINAETMAPVPGAGHDYIHLMSETVNLSNGSVSLNIAYPTPKGRGISPPVLFTYNSAGLFHLTMDRFGQVAFLPSDLRNDPHVTWSTSTLSPVIGHCPTCTPPPPVPCNFATGFTFTDLSGTSHNLGIGTGGTAGFLPNVNCVMDGGGPIPPGGTPAGVVAAPNGDGKTWGDFVDRNATIIDIRGCGSPSSGCSVGAFTVMDDSGTTYFFSGSCTYDFFYQVCNNSPNKIEDRNGNLITPDGAGSYFDTLHRSLSSFQGSQRVVGGVTYPVATCPGCASIPPNNYTVPVAATVDPFYAPINCPWGASAPSSLTVSGAQSSFGGIALPAVAGQSQQQFTFYSGNLNPNDSTILNSYGLINEIVYPGGGWVKYKWQMSTDYQQAGGFAGTQTDANNNPTGNYGVGCDVEYKTPVLVSRQVSYDGVTLAQTQTFSYTTHWSSFTIWDVKTTTVNTTDKLTGKTTVTSYTYSPTFAAQGFAPFSGASVGTGVPSEHTVQYNDWDGTPLRTVTKTWFTPSELQEEDVTENGKTRKTTYCYQ